MGQKNSRIKESTSTSSSSDEIEALGLTWLEVRAIVIYGVKKTTMNAMKWEFIACMDLENSVHPVDARQVLHDIIRDRPFDETYFSVSLYYHVSTESASRVIHEDIITNLNTGIFHPTRSLVEVSKAYYLYQRMMAQKGTKLF